MFAGVALLARVSGPETHAGGEEVRASRRSTSREWMVRHGQARRADAAQGFVVGRPALGAERIDSASELSLSACQVRPVTPIRPQLPDPTVEGADVQNGVLVV